MTDRIRAWRYGYTGITGLNEMQNNFKMLLILLGPFLGLWFGAQYIVYMEMLPEWFSPVILLLAIGVWCTYCVGYWAYVTTDASKYKGLPQASVHFPDGGVVKYNFLIKEEGITERCKFPDGGLGVEIGLLYRYMYQSRDMAFPYVFEKLLAKIPADVGKSFKFLSSGEFWHKGMIVDTPNNEHVSFYVFDWVKENGEWKPVGIINECSLNYAEALEKFLKRPQEPDDLIESDINWLLYQGALQREDEIKQYTETLEAALEVTREQSGKTFKKSVDDTLSAARARVHLITDTSIPLWKRIFNFKTLAYAILIAVFLWVFLHFGLKVI